MIKLIETISRIFTRKPDDPTVHVFDALDNSLNTAVDDLALLELQYNINTATGIWLDEYGEWFGVPRLLSEEDRPYGNRIIAKISKPKNTIEAIVETIRSYLGDPNLPVTVYEPYVDIRKFNQSAFSGNHRYQDGYYYRTAVIDISLPNHADAILVELVEQTKGAGIKVYFTRLYDGGEIEGGIVKLNTPNFKAMDLVMALDIPILWMLPQVVGRSEGNIRSGRRVIWVGEEKTTTILTQLHLSVRAGSPFYLSELWDIMIKDIDSIKSYATSPFEVETSPV